MAEEELELDEEDDLEDYDAREAGGVSSSDEAGPSSASDLGDADSDEDPPPQKQHRLIGKAAEGRSAGVYSASCGPSTSLWADVLWHSVSKSKAFFDGISDGLECGELGW